MNFFEDLEQVTPYIKGPEDRSLVIKDRVYSLES